MGLHHRDRSQTRKQQQLTRDQSDRGRNQQHADREYGGPEGMLTLRAIDLLDRRHGASSRYGVAVPEAAPSSSAIVAVDGPRSFWSRFATCSASASTRSTFPPASFRKSASLQPRRASSAKTAGYLETSSRPTTVSSMPSKSLPMPTWSTPATCRTCSIASATSAIVAVGRGWRSR